jgi:FMN-dependent NADH-azoreductase
MKRLLHIIATPRVEESFTLQISAAFLHAFREKHPEWIIDELDLSKEELPSLATRSVSGKYVLLSDKDLFGSLKESWTEIFHHIERFKTADLFLISTPMWNFHIPYMLKHYIDLIVQPRHLFRYKEDGSTEGFVTRRKMVVLTSRGGEYEGDAAKMDFQEPYLRAIFDFVGIKDITFIKAEGMNIEGEKRLRALATAIEKAKLLGENI